MPIFGYDSIGASSVNSLGRGYGHGNTSQHHTAGATDTITSLELYTRNIGDTAEIGVYDMGVGSTPNGATLIGSGTITATSDTAQWESVAVSIALTPGNNYFLAYASADGIRRYFDTGVAGDSTEDLSASSGTLPATWTEDATDTEIVSMRAVYDDGVPVFAISSTPSEIKATESTTGLSVVDAQTGLSAVNFTVKFEDDLGPAATVNNAVETSPGEYDLTITFPRVTDGQFTQAGRPLYVSDGSSSDTSSNVPWLPKTGQSFYNQATPDNLAEGSIWRNYAGSDAAAGDQVVVDDVTIQEMVGIDEIDDTGQIIWLTNPTFTNTFEFYRIDSTGTVDVEDTYIFFIGDGTVATSLTEALRNARLDEITAAMDAGTGAAKLFVYDGTRPAAGGAATTLIVETTYSDPSFPAAASASMTANAINDGTVVSAGSTTATWFRVTDSDDNWVMDGDVVGSGDGLVLSKNPVDNGDVISFTHTITEGNP